MKIAIIDDGIRDAKCLGLIVEQDVVVLPSGRIRERTKRDRIWTSHGTNCACIIQMYAGSDCPVEFVSVGIFRDWTLQTSIKQLIAALEWCYEQKVPIIHMSVGTTRSADFSSIRRIVRKMQGRGQVLVAALSNENKYTVPACLKGVLGVKANKNGRNGLHLLTQKEGIYSYLTRNGDCRIGYIQYEATAEHILSDITTEPYNSYAAPVVTGIIAKKKNRMGT